MQFEPYPFERLQALITPITPKQPVRKLTIGEPQLDTPESITQALVDHAHELRYYPPSAGMPYLREAMLEFIRARYGIELDSEQIIPTFGTREVLFNFPQFYLAGITSPVIAHPNPFYQIYEGAAIASGAKTIYMPLTQENNFKPSLSIEQCKLANLVILNSPNNPTGATLSLDELIVWVQKALEYDFVLLCDECYSEIYQIPESSELDSGVPSTHAPHPNAPASILQAAIAAGNPTFKNILALNSISKRSSAPGLRSGFIAGDREILARYQTYRTYAGLAQPLPLARASAAAWRDEQSALAIRKIYSRNLALAKRLFPDVAIAPYSFYIWLPVGDDLAFTTKLYQRTGILVLPGRFLGREGAGVGYVRIALVYPTEQMSEILGELARFYYEYKHAHRYAYAAAHTPKPLPPLHQARIHFIGIGGIGISGLAKYLRAQGATISGSDIAHSPTTHYLRSLGVQIHIPHNASAISNQDLIIHSAIIAQDNPEIIEARQRHIPVFSREQALKLILDSKRVYSVCGAHGKSSISAMLSSIFPEFGAIIGAESKEFHSNVREAQSECIIFEADESDKSFLNSNPYFAIVPNAEPEHMETYGHDERVLQAAYEEFLSKARLRCVNDSDDFLRRVKLPCLHLDPARDISDISYFLEDNMPYTKFRLRDLGEFAVFGLGEHVAQNASLAILTALESMRQDLQQDSQQNLQQNFQHKDSSPESSADSAPSHALYPSAHIAQVRQNLKNFAGIKKRFDILCTSELTIIDDYAHHPTEIRATIQSLQAYASLREIADISAIWQPHKYSRLFDNLAAFQACFEGAVSGNGRLIILPVWRAGEQPREVDFAKLFARYNPLIATRIQRTANTLAIYRDETLLTTLKSGVAIGFGAGDITYQLRGVK